MKTVVRDRDTIQLGLGKHTGALPLLGAFDDCNDLGFFAELTVPGCVGLVRKGIVTSRYAEVEPDTFVACFIGNSPEDMDLIERNPFFQLRSYEYTNDPVRIARHEQMLTLNGALMVDLSGQIGVYAMGPRVYSVSCDNALAHMLSDSDLERAAAGMAAKAAPGGLVLASIRDYDALACERPRFAPLNIHDAPNGQRLMVQLWDWRADGPIYALTMFILRRDGGEWRMSHHSSTLRAVRRDEVSAALARAGLAEVAWHLPPASGYYQPVVTARKPA